MRWTRGSDRSNVEDRRGDAGGGGGRGPGLRLGLGGFVVVAVLSIVLKRNLFTELGVSSGVSPSADVAPGAAPAAPSAAEEEQADFVTFVLNDAQDAFRKSVDGYQNATLVLFRDATDTACGMGESATGPFYCPADGKVYIDLAFYDALRSRFGAPGDFAQAYVIAHELGHHVQNITGIERKVRDAQQRSPSSRNELSVRMELQADCMAGVWAHDTARRDLLEKGDVEEALNAASQIGDDRLQKSAGGRVSPDSFTHGTSAQRVAWFRRGLDSGSLNACDTFRVREP
jgi:hypothetical protein